MTKRYKTVQGFIASSLCLGGIWVLAASAARHRDAMPPVRFREHLIDHLPGAYQCAVADINGDGKPDIIALSSSRSEIAWYENPTWKKHLITTATHGNIDIAANTGGKTGLDGDGKMAMTVASEFDLGNTHGGGRLQWFKPDVDVTAAWTGFQE